MRAKEISLPLPWGKLAGLHWPNPGAPRVLCLHGWLDNAASFVPLAPHLREFDLLALDFAGHGLSAHRPAAGRYYFPEYLYDLDAAMASLGWEQCHFIGHSMGGGVASNFAAALPERIARLVLLDAVGVLTRPADRTARQLCLSLKSVRKERGNLRRYASINEAVRARQKDTALSDKAARLLCERSLRHTGTHFEWCTDPRLNWRSPQLLTDAQALNLLSAIRAPTLVMTSPRAVDYLGNDMLQKRLAAIDVCTHVSVTGHHHFHMDQAEDIGPSISGFLHGEK